MCKRIRQTDHWWRMNRDNNPFGRSQGLSCNNIRRKQQKVLFVEGWLIVVKMRGWSSVWNPFLLFVNVILLKQRDPQIAADFWVDCYF